MMQRVVALDLLRGAAVAGMILVTSPGDWAHVYAPLKHADWNGWTAADTIFPAFLFAVGVALGLSFPRAWDARARRRFWARIGRRVAALVVLGLLLEATYNLAIALGAPFFGHADLGHLRLPGILQRIALCYGGTATLLAASGRRNGGSIAIDPRAIGGAIVLLLLGYWAAMVLVSVPGFGAGQLTPEGNFAGFVDREVFTPAHLWWLGWAKPGGPPVYDPEGLLSTLPAITDTLFGVLAAMLWLSRPTRPPLLIAGGGLLLLMAGLALDPLFVINKRIWTSSFALLSSGIAAMAFAALALAARSAPVLRLLAPLRVLGGNAIVAFALSTLCGRFYTAPLLAAGGARVSPAAWLQAHFDALVRQPDLASFLAALVVLALMVLLILPLHRRGLHLRL